MRLRFLPHYWAVTSFEKIAYYRELEIACSYFTALREDAQCFFYFSRCSGTDLHYCNSLRLLLVAVLIWREQIAVSLPGWTEERITIMWEVFVVTGVAL